MDQLKIGDIAAEPGSGRSGVIIEINNAGKARLLRGHKEAWWVTYADLKPLEPADIGGGFKFGQFVKCGDRDKLIGMALQFKDGGYTMLCADAKCYPKGVKFAQGKLYKASEVLPVTEEEKALFLFKLNLVHKPEEYAANLERLLAKWEGKTSAESVQSFKVFWERLLKGVGGGPGVTWGARLRTIYSPSPSVNFKTLSPEELQSNLFGFFSVSKEKTGPVLSVFLKKSSWIPESSRAYLPKSGDGGYFADGHVTHVPLAGKKDEELSNMADAIVGIYRAARNRPGA